MRINIDPKDFLLQPLIFGDYNTATYSYLTATNAMNVDTPIDEWPHAVQHSGKRRKSFHRIIKCNMGYFPYKKSFVKTIANAIYMLSNTINI